MLDPSFSDWDALPPVQGLALQRVMEQGASFTTDAGPLSLEAYAPGVLRLRLGETASPDYGIIVARPVPAAGRFEETAGGWRLCAGDAALMLTSDPVQFAVEARGRTRLRPPGDRHFRRRFRLPPCARTPSGWLVAFDLEEREPVYGHGEKWGPLDHRGQFLRSWTVDALGVNAELSYKSCALAWSPRGWAIFVHTPGRVHHAIGHPAWSHRTYALEAEGAALDLFLLVADTPAGLLERYTWLTGRPPGVPRWSLGAWLSKAYVLCHLRRQHRQRRSLLRQLPAGRAPLVRLPRPCAAGRPASACGRHGSGRPPVPARRGRGGLRPRPRDLRAA